MKNEGMAEIAALKDKEWNVRYWAGESLGKSGTLAVEPLIAALKNKDSDVRANAAIALGEIKDVRAVQPLIATLKDPDARWKAVQALVNIGEPAFEPLRGAMKDRDPSIQQGAAITLFESKDTLAVNAGQAVLNPKTVAAKDVYIVLINKGSSISEDILIEALRKFGNKEMAYDFANSGNRKLETAASDWASRNGYQIVSVPGGGGGSAIWGQYQ